jgi:hypothetical protein
MDKLLEKYAIGFAKQVGGKGSRNIFRTRPSIKPPILEPLKVPHATPSNLELLVDRRGKPLSYPVGFEKLPISEQVKLLTNAKIKQYKQNRIDRIKRFNEVYKTFSKSITSTKNIGKISISNVIANLKVLFTNPLVNTNYKKGIIVAVSIGILYNLFSGKKVSGKLEDTKKIADSINNSTQVGININEAIKLIEDIKQTLQDNTVISLFTNVQNNLINVLKLNVDLDNPSSLSSYTTAVQVAEDSINVLFENQIKIESLIVNKEQYNNLISLLTGFVLNVNEIRNYTIELEKTSSNNIDIIFSYSTYYHNTIIKKAILPIGAIVGGAMFASMILSVLHNHSAEINEVKEWLSDMSELITDQRKDGFGDYTKTFEDYDKSLKTVILLIDQMIKSTVNENDISLIEKMESFISASENILYKGNEVSGALKNLESIWGKLGNIVQPFFGAGFDLSDYNQFNTALGAINGSLSILITKIKDELVKKQLEAQKTTQVSRPTSSIEQLSGIIL